MALAIKDGTGTTQTLKTSLDGADLVPHHKVDNFPATQPVSVAALPLPAGASTEATLAAVLAKLTADPATQTTLAAILAKLIVAPSTEATLALIKAKTDNLDVALSTRTKPADTQPVSAASLPLPTGAGTEATLALIRAGTDRIPQPCNLAVTATGAAAAAVTLTLPAVAAQFHYIGLIEITMYSTVARTGSATPVVVTTTNLPGNPAFTFPSAGAVGTTERRVFEVDPRLRSVTVNTATTIVCPATTSVIWRVNVWYYVAT